MSIDCGVAFIFLFLGGGLEGIESCPGNCACHASPVKTWRQAAAPKERQEQAKQKKLSCILREGVDS